MNPRTGLRIVRLMQGILRESNKGEKMGILLCLLNARYSLNLSLLDLKSTVSFFLFMQGFSGFFFFFLLFLNELNFRTSEH